MAGVVNATYGTNQSDGQLTTHCTDEEGNTAIMIVKSFAYCVVIILSLLGNGLVIRIFFKNRSVKTTTNCFIVSMAASDIMLPIFVIPRHVLAVFEKGPYGLHVWHISGFIGELLCKLIPFIGDVSTSVSILTLVLISCDRYFAIVWPLSYKLHITPRRCNILILATWIISFIIHAPYFYSFKLYFYKETTMCVKFWGSLDLLDDYHQQQKNIKSQKTYFLFLLIVSYVLPLIIITFLYSSIIRELRVSIRNHSSQQRRQRRREDNRVIAMLVVIVTIFAVFFAPAHIIFFLQYFVTNISYQICLMTTIKFAFFFLSLSTCCVNPYIYFIFIRKYRHGARTLLKDFFASRLINAVCPVRRVSNCCFQKLDDLEDGLQQNSNTRHRNSSCRVRQTEHILLASEQEQTFQFETGV